MRGILLLHAGPQCSPRSTSARLGKHLVLHAVFGMGHLNLPAFNGMGTSAANPVGKAPLKWFVL